MVRFEDGKFIIEIESNTPIEDFLSMKSAVCNIIKNSTSDSLVGDDLYWAMELIGQSELSVEQIQAVFVS